MEIRSVIIDDDPFIQNLLKDKLDQFIPDIQIIGSASNGAEGIDMIQNLSPDLIFLDVEMGDMTGFEMLKRLGRISFETIFITSFSHYAIKAIRFNALDYLVKPIDLEELKQSIQRFKEKRTVSEQTGKDVERALINMDTKDVSDQTLTLNTQEGELRIKLGEIIRIEGERNYSFIYLVNGKRKLVSKTLGDLEDILSDKAFFRSHKSHLVNFFHIKALSNRKFLTLRNDLPIPISRRKYDDFKVWYDALDQHKRELT